MRIPHQQHPSLDVRHVPPDQPILVPRVVRDHLEVLLISHLQPLDVEQVIPDEEVHPVAHKLADVDIHDQRVAMLDGGLHRLAPAGDDLQVEVLFEFDAQFTEMARADTNVLDQFWEVVRVLTAAIEARTS